MFFVKIIVKIVIMFFKNFIFKKSDKKKKKKSMLKKVIGNPVKRTKSFFKFMKKAPVFLEWTICILFIGVVFVLFFKKAKNPSFLEHFKEIKLS